MTDNTEGFISLSKIVYKATLPPTDLQTVQFLLKLFQIIKQHAEDNNNFCRSILVEASRDTQKGGASNSS